MGSENQQFSKLKRFPPYVFDAVNRMKSEAISKGVDVIDLGMGNPDMPPPQNIVTTFINSLRSQDAHRYPSSAGKIRLREAVRDWYAQNYNVKLDHKEEIVVTIGSKEGIAHLSFGITEKGDNILLPAPTYPPYAYSFLMAEAHIHFIPIMEQRDFFTRLEKKIRDISSPVKALILNFPSNPTTLCVDTEFFQKIITIAQRHKIWIIHDLSYADIVFDGYRAPSLLQIPGAKDFAVEFYSLSKGYNMAGWRVGFCCGNPLLVSALAQIKRHIDSGIFNPIQEAAIEALKNARSYTADVRENYMRRRDILCEGLNSIGWKVSPPKATMYIWTKIPDQFFLKDSIRFVNLLLSEARVLVYPGVGFGEYGEGYVRLSLTEKENRIRQAVDNIYSFMKRQA